MRSDVVVVSRAGDFCSRPVGFKKDLPGAESNGAVEVERDVRNGGSNCRHSIIPGRLSCAQTVGGEAMDPGE